MTFMRWAVPGIVLCGALAGCSGVVIGSGHFTRSYADRVPAAGLRELILQGGNGDVRARAAHVGAVRIRARIETSDIASLAHDTVSVSRSAGVLSVASVCPSAHIVFWRVQRCGIDYDIEYPANLRASFTIVNGDVTVLAPASPVTVGATNGDVTISQAAGDVAGQSHEGDVTVSLARGWRGRSIAMRSTFGDIRLAVPAGFRARVRTHTVAGDVTGVSSYPLGPASADLSTTFGDIEVHHSP